MVTNIISQQQKLSMAKQIAKDYGYFVVNYGNVAIPRYLLYRVDTPKNVFVGKRKSIDGMLTFVKKVTGYK